MLENKVVVRSWHIFLETRSREVPSQQGGTRFEPACWLSHSRERRTWKNITGLSNRLSRCRDDIYITRIMGTSRSGDRLSMRVLCRIPSNSAARSNSHSLDKFLTKCAHSRMTLALNLVIVLLFTLHQVDEFECYVTSLSAHTYYEFLILEYIKIIANDNLGINGYKWMISFSMSYI